MFFRKDFTMKKVILSLDTGIDDAMALAYTIAKDELDLIGVVGTYGNVYTEQGAKNALALLKMLGKTDIPVFSEMITPLTKITSTEWKLALISTEKTELGK